MGAPTAVPRARLSINKPMIRPTTSPAPIPAVESGACDRWSLGFAILIASGLVEPGTQYEPNSGTGAGDGDVDGIP